MPQHVFESTAPPASAPTRVGQHWIDTSEPAAYLSVGTATVADWVKLFPLPIGAMFRVKPNGEFQLYNPETNKYNTIFVLGAEGAEQPTLGPAEA